jgi:multiple sugar transport system substrate-binding protein
MEAAKLSWAAVLAGVSVLGYFSLRNGAPKAPPGSIELRYMAWGNPQQLAIEKEIVAQFNRENPGIHVRLFEVPQSSYANKMLVMLASRTAPEVMRVDQYVFPSLVRKGFFKPLDKLAKADPEFNPDDFFPQAMEECYYDDKLYALNVLFGGVLVYYNKTLVKKAGLEDPFELWKKDRWTWDTFRTHAEKMTVTGADGKRLSFGAAVPSNPTYLASVWSFGGRVMDDKKEKVLLGEGGAAESHIFWRNLRWKSKAAPTPAQAANSVFSFESGKVGMVLDWMGMSPRYREAALNFDWDVTPLPRGPAGAFTMTKGNQLVMTADCRHPNEAWRFMKFVTSERTERFLAITKRRTFPSRKAIAYSKEYLDSGERPRNGIAFVKAVESGRPLPITSRFGDWLGRFNSEIDLFWMNPDGDPYKILKAAQDKANAALQIPEGL